jgi:hypothetical protein
MATDPPELAIDIGRVLSRGFEALKADFLPYFALAFLLLGLPAFLGQYFLLSLLGPEGPLLAPTPDGTGPPINFETLLSPAFWGPIAATGLASLVGVLLLQIMLTRSTILHLSGRAPDLAGSAILAVRLALPAFGLSICVVFLLVIGTICVVFPALMIWCALIVALPVMVQERAGIFGSMARSRALTRGSRWRIFLLVVLLWILSMLVSGVTSAIGAATSTFDGTVLVPNLIVSGIADGLGSTLTGLVTNILIAALYVELREVKEGTASTQLATVFD